MREPSILLFDLGAVLIDISFDRVFASWSEAGNRSAADLKARFSMEASYEAHERGHIHSTEYWQALRNLLGLDLSDHDFERGWNEVFQGEITEVTGLLPQLDLPLYVFSNTNRVHQDRFESAYADALTPFHAVFTSNDLGERKPDAAAFEKVAEATDTPLSQILFFDDSPKNIAGAEAVGMQTCHVTDPTVVRPELERRGML